MADQATERMIMRATPERCLAVVTDFDRYPEWASDIKRVTVLARDDDGRATQVAFRAAAFGRSANYTLAYDYRKAPDELSWVLVNGDLTAKLDGAYRFDSAGDGDTEVTYRLVAELKIPLPGFIKRRAESRIISTALKQLRARVESGS